MDLFNIKLACHVVTNDDSMYLGKSIRYFTAQKMKFSIKNFFNKCDQIRNFLRIWPHLLKKSLMENFIFVQCFTFQIVVNVVDISDLIGINLYMPWLGTYF